MQHGLTTLAQCNTFGHVDVFKTTCRSSSRDSEGGRAVVLTEALVDVRGQGRTDRLGRGGRKAAVTEISTSYQQAMQHSFAECTTRQDLKEQRVGRYI